MKYRVAKILAEESLSAAGTKTIDLNVTEPISRIDLRYQVTKSKNDMDGPPAKDITKIELVDGSDVLHSLSGYENQALCIYDRPAPTMNHGQHWLNNSQRSVYGIDFGRFLWDPLLAFLPGKFKNPQLKITYNTILSDTGGTSPLLEVIAHIFDEKAVSPVGFLMSKEIYSADSPASGAHAYVDLPTDYPIRQMLLRGYEDGYEPWQAILEARLDEDNLKRIPLDWDIEQYYQVMKGVWKAVEEGLFCEPDTAGVVFYLTPTDYYASVMGTGQDVAVPVAMGTSCRGGKATLYGTANANYGGMARGYLPNHCVQFPFGLQQEPDDWYDVTKKGSVKLRITGGARGASTEFQVVLQQLRKY
ncbi:hypothetical protein ES703_124464 [subsurface metagenome]